MAEEAHVADAETKRDLTVREETDGSAIVEFTDAGGEPLIHAKDAEGDEDKDEQLSAAETSGKTEAEIEEIRAHRRAERKHRKEVKKEREKMQERQLEAEREARRALEERLAVLEHRNNGTELANLDKTIEEVTNAHSYWKQQIARAAAASDGVTLADATEKMFAARQKHAELLNVRNAVLQQKSQPAALDPRMLTHANNWMGDNKWYDPQAKDEDSRIVRVIDDGVKADGFDPSTPQYWKELSDRISRRLPHRAGGKESKGDGAPPSHVTGSDKGSSQTSGSTKNSFRLSSERVKAMKDAGTWDDPVKRAKQVSAYQKYDREHS